MKTSELIGAALDWAVAVTEGYDDWDGEMFASYKGNFGCACFLADWKPSTVWSQGGPIIEEKRIDLFWDGDLWDGSIDRGRFVESGSGSGPTPLVAAMRCYVSFKLGDDINIPEELCT